MKPPAKPPQRPLPAAVQRQTAALPTRPPAAHVAKAIQCRPNATVAGLVKPAAPALPRPLPAAHLARAVQLKKAEAPATRHSRAPAVIQSRFYDDGPINQYIQDTPQNHGEADAAYLTRITASFKRDRQYFHRDDLKYLRKQVGHHRSLLVANYVQANNLDAHFDAHVLGNQAGVGWHSESVRTNGMNLPGNHNPPVVGWSYNNWGWIAQSKGTYWADNIVVVGAAKAGNNGVSCFFPAGMAIAKIRREALYVANTNGAAVGQLIRGRGKETGIVIECLMNGNTITSAYPWQP